jgi:hypothetical protein
MARATTRSASIVVGKFCSRQPVKRAIANTATDGESLTLWGNKIAWWEGDTICLTIAGHATMLTVGRLNDITQRLMQKHLFYREGHDVRYQPPCALPASRKSKPESIALLPYQVIRIEMIAIDHE